LLFLNVGHGGLSPGTMLEPGEEFALESSDDTTFDISLAVTSLAPLERVEIIVNGSVAHTWGEADFVGYNPNEVWKLSTTIELPGSGWIAARAIGPPSEYVGDAFPFAQTSPVYIIRDGHNYTSVEDAQFLLEAINILWDRVETRDTFNTDTERRAYSEAIGQARAIFQHIIDGR